eukprot:3481914-Alexandrium_andersonii.AAC.1
MLGGRTSRRSRATFDAPPRREPRADVSTGFANGRVSLAQHCNRFGRWHVALFRSCSVVARGPLCRTRG